MYKDAINEVREWLNSYFGESFYMDEAPDEAEYPYKVGHLGASFENQGGSAEVHAFDVDYWDFGKSYDKLYSASLTDRGDGDVFAPSGLDHRRVALESCNIFVTFDGQQPIEDPDRSLRRLRASYDIHINYRKQGETNA